jgi:putative ABC transport system permease protein
MRALDRKLLRDLWKLRGVVLAIALVLVGGVATYIMSLSTYDSLLVTRDRYYRGQRLAEVFASLKRAPETLVERVREIPGVEKVATRVVAAVNVDIPGFPDPVSGRLISVPDRGEPLLNGIYLRRGRMVDSRRDDEVLVSESFAEAHRFRPGDEFYAIINGRRKKLTLVGIVLSPEYIYEIQPGAAFPDYQRFGVMWMARTPLAAAYDMEGAFNDIALTLTAGTHPDAVINRLDRLLDGFGGHGAYPRTDQLSYKFLSEELHQMQTMATVFPIIFLGVAAFLLNVVISRLIATEREEIGILKAFGYGNTDVGLHYVKLVLMIVMVGIAGGVAGGIWLGRGMAGVYTDTFQFPYLDFVLRPVVIVSAALVAVAAALTGTLHAVNRAVRLPPVEAMRAEAPAVYRPTVFERIGMQHLLAQPSRMIIRHIERRPLKALLTMAGMTAACGIVMVSNFQEDAIRYMVDVQYKMAANEDLSVHFIEPVSSRALYSLRSIEGVKHVEGFRAASARLRFEHRSYRTALEGVEPDGRLRRLLDADLRPIRLPQRGVVMTDYLAAMLRMKPGDRLRVEILEGARPVLEVPLVGTTRQYLGVSAYLPREELNRLLREGDVVSGAYLATDARLSDDVYARLKETPRVAGTVIQEAAIAQFYQTMEQTILFFTMVAAGLGAVIAFGVVYNSARIGLSERGRELASLRVLGFTVGEIAYILLGELMLLALVSLPFGFVFGRLLCEYLASQFDSDLYRVPAVLEPVAYSFTALVIILSTVVSGYLIWLRLRRLDLIAVLKTRE